MEAETGWKAHLVARERITAVFVAYEADLGRFQISRVPGQVGELVARRREEVRRILPRGDAR